MFNELAHQNEAPRERLLGEVQGRGQSGTFEAGQTIRVEPYSHTQGADPFSFDVDYRFYDGSGNLLPNHVPVDSLGNAIPAYTRTVTTGFGGGFPVETFTATSQLYSRVQWRITIPQQTVTHQNSAGWNLRVYEVLK